MENSEKECAFCAIGAGRDATAEIVAEADRWVAFFPLNPATPGHTLIIPRDHVGDLWQADLPLGQVLMAACITLGRAITVALGSEGMNLITSAGVTAEQSVFHLHLHVVPRWSKDGFGRIWPTGDRWADANMEQAADRIREAWRDC